MSIYDNEYVRMCPKCHLVYAPDGVVYKEPDKYCPRCGYELAKKKEEHDDE